MADPGLARFVEAMPKVELHLHLEGSLRPATLLRLARRRGVDLPASTEEGLARWFRFRDFEEFVRIYVHCSRCLRDPEDFQLVAEELAAEQKRQNVVWSEVHSTISTHVAQGSNAGEIADALGQTLAAIERRRGIGLRLIPDVVRNLDPGRADQTLEWAVEGRDRGVVALGLSGIESFPLDPFVEHFEEAGRRGLHRVAHAGEHGGPRSIEAALARLGAERIGHGVRAVDDPALLAELASTRVPLEVCPTSNVLLGVAPDLERHPFGRLREAGLALSVNTDDPGFFATNLTREYLAVGEAVGLGAEELAGLSVAALRQSFAPEERRRELERRLFAEAAELGERHLGRAVVPAVDGVVGR